MRRKVKDFLTDLVAGIVMLLLFCTFVLSFIFVDNYFFPCLVAGILATIVFAALHWGKEIVRG